MFSGAVRKISFWFVLVSILVIASTGLAGAAGSEADNNLVSHLFEGEAWNLNDIEPVWEGNGNILSVCNISDDIIAIYMEDGIFTHAQLVEYEYQAGDRINRSIDYRNLEVRELFRKRKFVGFLIQDNKYLSISEQFIGKATDKKVLMDAQNYTIYSHDDPDYNEYVKPAQVWFKTLPGNYSSYSKTHVTKNTVYLKLDKPMKEGCSYYIVLDNINVVQNAGVYTYDPKNVVSEAVHTNQAGYRPDDPGKCAFLSVWMGDGGGMTYPEGLDFHIINEKGEEVYTGKTVLARAASKPEFYGKTNRNLTDVYRMEFADLTTPGKYTLYVDGIGAGYDIVIADDVWEDALKISMKGFYNQRSGIELLPEYTDYVKPRSMHPDDGFVVYASTCSLLDSGNGLNALGTDEDNFGNLVGGLTDEVVENAWGGYFDAGDWDRRIQHLEATRAHLELFLLNPEYFMDLDLNIPESSNNIPDILDEAMWNIDCYKRMQLPDGGIRGGIESAEHPRKGETSWTETLTIMAYAPDHWSSHIYAGVAARLSTCLRMIGEDEMADDYLQSAIKAFAWAEKEYDAWKDRTDVVKKAKQQCLAERVMACVDMYRATEDKYYGDLFSEILPLNGHNNIININNSEYTYEDAAFAYTMLPEHLRNERTYEICREASIWLADSTILHQKSNAFEIAGRGQGEYRGWGFYSSPRAKALVRAHQLTGNDEYLFWLVRAVQFATGCNSLNMSMTTGLGENPVRFPTVVDQRNSGIENPPIGLTVFGPFEKVHTTGQYFIADRSVILKYVYPEYEEWPDMDSFFDSYNYGSINEFVIHSMYLSTYAWGYLAQR